MAEGARSACSGGVIPVYIDHLPLDEQAVEFLVPDSFGQLAFSEQDEENLKLSDHCPIFLELALLEGDKADAEARAEALFEEIRALVRGTREKVEELHDLIPLLKE